jgi:hypothetical protein
MLFFEGHRFAMEASKSTGVQIDEQTNALHLVFSATDCSSNSCGVQIPSPLSPDQSMPTNGYL